MPWIALALLGVAVGYFYGRVSDEVKLINAVTPKFKVGDIVLVNTQQNAAGTVVSVGLPTVQSPSITYGVAIPNQPIMSASESQLALRVG